MSSFVLTAAAVWMDFAWGRVKNWWICIFWALGAVRSLLDAEAGGILSFAAGSVFPVLLLFPLFRFRMLGPGDIKLFSALGGLLGARAAGICMILSFFCGGILSAGILLLRGNLISRLRYFTEYFQNMINSREIVPYYVPGRRPENFHFTVAILMGLLLYAGGVY